MQDKSHRRTILLFGALAAYIILQFVWWGVLLLRKDREVSRLALEVQALGGEPGAPLDADRGLRMVLGEGIVFLVLLLVVLYLTFRAIRRDLERTRAQRNFLMAVTHELRTPIAAIKLQLQTLERPVLDEVQQRTLRQQALQEADRLAHLTDKVLLAASAEDGILDMDRSNVDVMHLMQGVMERARAQVAPRHHLELKGPDVLHVHSDPQALRSIADNLIENASKYAPEGTTITVEVIQGREGWRLVVADEGPGVPAAEQTRIFDKFYRSGNEETRRAKGTGLGLYIVQRLAQRLGGQVTVKDRHPSGAIFAASFPNR
jgi:signal transduction histidine kinase